MNNSPPLPQVNYDDFSRRLFDKMPSRRIPFHGEIDLTHRCNLRCVHCYIPPESHKIELSTKEFCKIIDSIVDAGCLWLVFTGGEPLVREDFVDIYIYARRKGLLVTIFTNGTMVDSETADLFERWPPFSIEISLYGITKETYERITRVKGSFERCLRGIHLLLRKRLPLALKTMVLTLNRHEVSEIKKFAEGLGVEFRSDPIINPRLDGCKQPCAVRLAPEEVVKFDLEDGQRSEGINQFCQQFFSPVETEELFSCGAGINSFHIDPYGFLRICAMVRAPRYSICTGSFEEGWSEFIPRVRAQRSTDGYACKRCEKIALCGQCPGWAQLENGDQEEPVEYLCKIANLRAKAFGARKENNDGYQKIKEAV